MNRRTREHEAARRELRDAAAFYEHARDGQGDVFLHAVDAAIRSLLDPSVGWGFYDDRATAPQLYSRSVHGFPYDVIYVVADDEIVIMAYAAERRRPGYRGDRIPEL